MIEPVPEPEPVFSAKAVNIEADVCAGLEGGISGTIINTGADPLYNVVVSAAILLMIALYLTWMVGWPVLVFSVLGAVLCMYGRGLLYHESMMAFGALFLVIGAFYVQVGTFNIESVIWLKVVFLSLFSFFSQYGWLHMYRLDHYGWSERERNRGILITKMGLPFLILYFLVDLF